MATTGSSSGGSTVTIPQGAGGPQQLNFGPASLTVSAGATITFSDQDTSAIHDVHFTSGPSGATLPPASPNLSKGSTFTVTLTAPGTYDYICDYHPWMKGTITVTG
ncbi:MAG: plastocyanin/azurin family copper-binding protein [Nitrososphaerales archaeon]